MHEYDKFPCSEPSFPAYLSGYRLASHSPRFIDRSTIRKRWKDSWIKWEDVYKKFPADTMSIFFIDNRIYEQTDWEEVRNEYMILKRG